MCVFLHQHEEEERERKLKEEARLKLDEAERQAAMQKIRELVRIIMFVSYLRNN